MEEKVLFEIRVYQDKTVTLVGNKEIVQTRDGLSVRERDYRSQARRTPGVEDAACSAACASEWG